MAAAETGSDAGKIHTPHISISRTPRPRGYKPDLCFGTYLVDAEPSRLTSTGFPEAQMLRSPEFGS